MNSHFFLTLTTPIESFALSRLSFERISYVNILIVHSFDNTAIEIRLNTCQMHCFSTFPKRQCQMHLKFLNDVTVHRNAPLAHYHQ